MSRSRLVGWLAIVALLAAVLGAHMLGRSSSWLLPAAVVLALGHIYLSRVAA